MININDLPPKYQEQAKLKLNMQEKSASYNKYGALKDVRDGITFDSQKEAKHYDELKLLERDGVIKNLVLQPVFELQGPFIHDGKKERAIKYIADFQYERDGKIVVEDVKGLKTPVYKLKRKMFLRKYGDLYVFREL